MHRRKRAAKKSLRVDKEFQFERARKWPLAANTIFRWPYVSPLAANPSLGFEAWALAQESELHQLIPGRAQPLLL